MEQRSLWHATQLAPSFNQTQSILPEADLVLAKLLARTSTCHSSHHETDIW